MKKKVLFTIVMIVACSMFELSCGHETIQELEQPKVTAHNPFDFVGEMHNAGLDAVMHAAHITKSGEFSHEEIEYLTREFCQTVYSMDERFFLSIETKTEEGNKDTTEKECLSEAALKYYEEIIQVAETNDYDYIRKRFAIFEEEIMNIPQGLLTEYDTVFLLCSIAIGKYSNEYWCENAPMTKGLFASLVVGDLIGAGRGIAAHAVEIVICGAIGGVGCGLAAAGRAALGPAIVSSAEAGLLYAAAQL